MPDITWLAQVGGVVLVGAVLTGVALRWVLSSAYRSGSGRPENPPSANSANDRTPPGV